MKRVLQGEKEVPESPRHAAATKSKHDMELKEDCLSILHQLKMQKLEQNERSKRERSAIKAAKAAKVRKYEADILTYLEIS